MAEKQAPPLAVVGSQISYDEELFGKVFDKWVARRFVEYLKPYKRELYLAVGAVLLFTITQLSIPLIIRAVIDDALVAENAAGAMVDTLALVFVAVVITNYIANHTQETIVGKVAEHLGVLGKQLGDLFLCVREVDFEAFVGDPVHPTEDLDGLIHLAA